MGYFVKSLWKKTDTFFMETTQISFRLPKALLDLIDELAERDLRTRTNMLEYILMNWLREHEPDAFDDFGNILPVPEKNP